MTPGTSRLIACVAGAVTVLVTALLGQWQLRRADEKQQAQALLTARQQLPAWQSADWPCDGRSAEALPVQRPAQLTGTWLPERTVWLDNRTQQGRTGFEVVTPLRLHAPGSLCDGRMLLVQRGWVPRHAHDRLHVPDLPTATGLVTVPGRVVASVSRVYQLGAEPLPVSAGGDAVTSTRPQSLIRQNVDAAFWQAWLGQSPLPGAVLQVQAEAERSPNASTAPAVLSRQWAAPDLGRDKHLAYAAQWFALSAVAGGLTLWFQFVRPRRLARRLARSAHHAAS